MRAGDLVRFRQWDDMEAEFGSDCDTIDCASGFPREMEPLCGVTVVVRECIGQTVYLSKESEELVRELTNDWWNYSIDMFEVAEQPIEPVNLDLFLEG